MRHPLAPATRPPSSSLLPLLAAACCPLPASPCQLSSPVPVVTTWRRAAPRRPPRARATGQAAPVSAWSRLRPSGRPRPARPRPRVSRHTWRSRCPLDPSCPDRFLGVNGARQIRPSAYTVTPEDWVSTISFGPNPASLRAARSRSVSPVNSSASALSALRYVMSESPTAMSGHGLKTSVSPSGTRTKALDIHPHWPAGCHGLEQGEVHLARHDGDHQVDLGAHRRHVLQAKRAGESQRLADPPLHVPRVVDVLDTGGLGCGGGEDLHALLPDLVQPRKIVRVQPSHDPDREPKAFQDHTPVEDRPA
jgi:hypothetical protein